MSTAPPLISGSLRNESAGEEEDIHNVVFVVLSVLGVVLSITSNAASLYILNRTTGFRQVECLFYKYLSLNDVCIALCAASIVATLSLKFGEICVDATLIFIAILYSSFVLIVVININRCLTIRLPRRYSQLITPRRFYVTTAAAMFSMFGLVVFVKFMGVPSHLYEDVCGTQAPGGNSLSDTTGTLLISAPAMIGFLIILGTSTTMLYLARQQALRLADLQVQGQPMRNNALGQQRFNLAGFKGLKTVAIITVSYLIVWLPYMMSILARLQGLPVPAWVNVIMFFAFLCNSAWNPFILLATNMPYRAAARKTLQHLKSPCGRL